MDIPPGAPGAEFTGQWLPSACPMVHMTGNPRLSARESPSCCSCPGRFRRLSGPVPYSKYPLIPDVKRLVNKDKKEKEEKGKEK
jgi:hypothetical protein